MSFSMKTTNLKQKMLRVILTIAALLLSATTSMADLSKEERDELFQRMDQMCEDADAEITRYLEFEGDAGARGILKLVGAEISGSITLQQFENLEQRFNDFRTNPTICQFEAIRLLMPIFSSNGSDSRDQSRLSVDPIAEELCKFNPDYAEQVGESWGDGQGTVFRKMRYCNEDMTRIYEIVEMRPSGTMDLISDLQSMRLVLLSPSDVYE